jgi:AcrR family transcriptional regulator
VTSPATDPRAARSREAILAAAFDLLAREGPGAITQQRVARQAGVGRATACRHWPWPRPFL